MKGVTVLDIKKIHEDNRGKMYEVNIRETTNLIVGYRKKGSVSGCHFHKGEEKSKSPEIFLLIKGKVKLIAENLDGEKMESNISGPVKILIEPYVYHEFHGVEDFIFIELKPEHDEYKDNYGKEEFLNLRKRK